MSAPTGTLTKSQKKRHRKKIQEQQKRIKQNSNSHQQQQQQQQAKQKDDSAKINIKQLDQHAKLNPEMKQDKQMSKCSDIVAESSKILNQLIKKSAELKKKQKQNAKNKDKYNQQLQRQTIENKNCIQESSFNQKDSTDLSQMNQNNIDQKDQKLSKKQKLNQKKKRQRIEKKKREQQEQCQATIQDSQNIAQNEAAMLEMYKLDPQEFMEDDQLKLLIEKYDPAMNQQDVDYLMQHEDREAVINTLYTKLLEREQINMHILQENDALVQSYHDIIDEPDIFYEDEVDGNYASSVGGFMTGRHSHNDMSSQNYVYNQQCKYYFNTQDKCLANERNNLIKENGLQLQVQNWQQKIQQNIEVLDQVECETIELAEKGSTEQRVKSQSNISQEEELYDSEFESELQIFQKKLQPKSRECSIERIYLSQQSRKNGCLPSIHRKLVPNISKEWIQELKKEIENYNNKLNRSQDQRRKQIKQYQNKKLQQGEKSSNSDKFRSPNEKYDINYADVGDSSVTDAKQRLSLPNFQQEFHDDCFKSQRTLQHNDQADCFQRSCNLGSLDVFPQKSGGIGYPLQGCTTNSTEGHSFNSPRANDQIDCYDEGDICAKNQQVNKKPGLTEEYPLGATAIFINGTDNQESNKVANCFINQMQQDQINTQKHAQCKQQTKGNTDKKKSKEQKKTAEQEPSAITKKNMCQKATHVKQSINQKQLSA